MRVEFVETVLKKGRLMEDKKKKKNILIRILEWIATGNKKAVESGKVCRS